MREDISYIAKGNSKANNKFMECYDISEKSKYNTYLDANNLYGWAMSQYLPNSEFNWLNRKQNISDFRLNSISENSSIGYVLEVDLEYPSELHELLNDCQNMLSKFCFNIANEYGIKNWWS